MVDFMKNLAILISLFISVLTLTMSHGVLITPALSKSSLTTNGNLTTLAATILQNPDDKFTVRLHVENYTTGDLSIKLKSSTTVLHKETVSHTKYARKYDMYNLPIGDYEIEVKNEKEKFAKKLTIKVENGKRVLLIN